MNQDSLLPASSELTVVSKLWPGVGIGLTTLVVLFLAFDAITKIMQVAPVLEACQKMGFGPRLTLGLGVLLLLLTVLYATPKTAILGAVLLTGYLGGATTAHVLARSGAFPTAFAVGFGVLTWAGLILREPRLLRWLFLHQPV